MTAFLIILLLLALGKLCAVIRVFPEDAPETLNRVVIHLCLPALIFIHAPELELNLDLLPLVIIPWVLLGLSVVLVLGASRALGFRRDVEAVLLVLVPLGNTSFLGYPLISALLGEDMVSLAVVYDQFGSFLIVCTFALFVIATYSGGSRPSPLAVARTVVTFPPFVALVLALILGNQWFPGWLAELVDLLAGMLIPLVTLAVGLQLRLKLIPAHRLPLALGLSFKLLLLPAAAWGLALVLGADRSVMQVGVLEAAMPPMITAGALVSAAGLAPRLATALVGYGVLASAVTIPLWYWLLVAH